MAQPSCVLPQFESVSSIDKVVSNRSATFRGTGLPFVAVATAETVICLIPKICAKKVGTIACSLTWIAFAAPGPSQRIPHIRNGGQALKLWPAGSHGDILQSGVGVTASGGCGKV